MTATLKVVLPRRHALYQQETVDSPLQSVILYYGVKNGIDKAAGGVNGTQLYENTNCFDIASSVDVNGRCV